MLLTALRAAPLHLQTLSAFIATTLPEPSAAIVPGSIPQTCAKLLAFLCGQTLLFPNSHLSMHSLTTFAWPAAAASLRDVFVCMDVARGQVPMGLLATIIATVRLSECACCSLLLLRDRQTFLGQGGSYGSGEHMD